MADYKKFILCQKKEGKDDCNRCRLRRKCKRIATKKMAGYTMRWDKKKRKFRWVKTARRKKKKA